MNIGIFKFHLFSFSLELLIVVETRFYSATNLELCSSILAKFHIKPQERKTKCFCQTIIWKKQKFSPLFACKLELCMAGVV